MYRFRMLAVACTLAAPFYRLTDAHADDVRHFRYSGPISEFLAPGIKVAPVAEGLPFSVVLTDEGKTIAPAQFDLTIPNTKGSIKLSLTDLNYGEGHLNGGARIANAGNASIQGVRLDVVSAVETYKAKDEKGAYLKDDKGDPILRTHINKISINSPLHFGDFVDKEVSEPLTFSAGPLKWTPDTTQIAVNGVVSGLCFVGSFTNTLPEGGGPGDIDIDAQGKVYIADVVGLRVGRFDADGQNAKVVGVMDAQSSSVAIEPKTNEIFAVAINNGATLWKFKPDGTPDGQLTGEQSGLEVYLHHVRFDRRGTLYGGTDGAGVYRLKNGKLDLALRTIGETEIAAHGFDIAADGSFWISGDSGLMHVDVNGTKAQTVAASIDLNAEVPDWHLGRTVWAASCRIDAAGNIYVVEGGNENAEKLIAPRVSVFDAQGRFVRAFGRGGQMQKVEDGNWALWPGEVYRPTDLAFAPNGRVYIANKTADDHMMLIYQPF